MLSRVSQNVLWRVERPPLVSALTAQGEEITLYSYVTGLARPLALWNGSNLHIFVLASLALVLAVPLRSVAQRARLAAVALGVVTLISMLICVVQVKSVAGEAAMGQLGLALYTAREQEFLDQANRVLIMFGMLFLPSFFFLVSYMTFWASPAPASVPGAGGPAGRRRSFPLAQVAAGAVLIAVALALLAPAAPPTPAGFLEGLRRVIDLNPSSARARLNLGVYFESQGRLKEAAAAYRESVGLDPGLAVAHYGLGNVLFKQGAVESAAEAYREALRRDPDNASAYQNLGIALFERQSFDEAAHFFEEALRRDSRLGAAHHDLGLTLLKLDRPCEALPHLERSAALGRSPADAAAMQAEVLRLKRICRDPG